MVIKKRIHYLCEDGIEKSAARDYRLSSVVMDGTLGSKFFKPEKNLEFFRLKF